jgi:Mn-dependent DtxR family transcriptional regulator
LTEEVTSQTEEFLESIYRLQERDGVARTSELVKMLNIVPGTVTNTVERLEKRELIKHEAYRGVKLPPSSEKAPIVRKAPFRRAQDEMGPNPRSRLPT